MQYKFSTSFKNGNFVLWIEFHIRKHHLTAILIYEVINGGSLVTRAEVNMVWPALERDEAPAGETDFELSAS